MNNKGQGWSVACCCTCGSPRTRRRPSPPGKTVLRVALRPRAQTQACVAREQQQLSDRHEVVAQAVAQAQTAVRAVEARSNHNYNSASSNSNANAAATVKSNANSNNANKDAPPTTTALVEANVEQWLTEPHRLAKIRALRSRIYDGPSVCFHFFLLI